MYRSTNKKKQEHKSKKIFGSTEKEKEIPKRRFIHAIEGQILFYIIAS